MRDIHKTKSQSENELRMEQGARRRNVWKWTERSLLAYGFVLLAIYGAARFETFMSYRTALKDFADFRPAVEQSGEKLEGEADAAALTDLPGEPLPPNPDFRLWSAQRVLANQKASGHRSAVPLAVLRIAKIGLEVPVFEGTDALTLNHGVGRIGGTARPGEDGNIGLAGHRDGFFRGLKDVRAGDEMELRTLQGTDRYIVEQIQIVKPENVEVLRPRSVPSLTLVTCYPFYFIGSAPQRYIVTASLLPETKTDRELASPDRYQNQAVEKEKQ